MTRVRGGDIQNASRKLLSKGRRQGQAEDPRHLSGRAAGIWEPLLCDQRKRRLRADLPDEGLERDRGEAGEIAFASPDQAEISDTDELLRSGGRTGRPGTRAAASHSA